MTGPRQYWHITPTGQIRRCYTNDPTHREGQESDETAWDPERSRWARYGCLMSLREARRLATPGAVQPRLSPSDRR